MVFYTSNNGIWSYHVDSSHYPCLFWVSLVQGWGSEVSFPKTLPRITQGIHCDSNPGPKNYESNTSPLSHAGPHCLERKNERTKMGGRDRNIQKKYVEENIGVMLCKKGVSCFRKKYWPRSAMILLLS